jgi:hypothetical protein
MYAIANCPAPVAAFGCGVRPSFGGVRRGRRKRLRARRISPPWRAMPRAGHSGTPWPSCPRPWRRARGDGQYRNRPTRRRTRRRAPAAGGDGGRRRG